MVQRLSRRDFEFPLQARGTVIHQPVISKRVGMPNGVGWRMGSFDRLKSVLFRPDSFDA
jgi:hypothetical protein